MNKIILTSLTVVAALALTPAIAKEGERGGKRPSFTQLDANGDGAVTLQEMQARGAARFAEADANGDGSLSVQEMVAHASAKNAERAQKRAERMLKRLDANNNGTLEQSEMKQPGKRGERMFGKMDSNGDGKITQAEFDAAKGQRRGPKNDG